MTQHDLNLNISLLGCPEILSEAELKEAEAELARLETRGEMYLSASQHIRNFQIQLFAMGLKRKKSGCPETESSANKAQQVQILQEKKIAREMVGSHSIYADVSYTDSHTKSTQVVTYLFDVFHPQQKNNLLILGGVGSGKTYGAVAYVGYHARLWHHKSLPVIDASFVRAYQISELIQRNEWERLDEIRNKKWLIVDDLGIEAGGYKSTDFKAFFEDLFIQRHAQKRRTIMTSNATLDQVRESLGERFLSRLRETGEIYQTNDPDFRREGI